MGCFVQKVNGARNLINEMVRGSLDIFGGWNGCLCVHHGGYMGMKNRVFYFLAGLVLAMIIKRDVFKVGGWIPALEEHKNSRIKIKETDLFITIESCEFDMQGSCCNKYEKTYLTGYDGKEIKTICVQLK